MTTYSITGVQIERDIDDKAISVTDVALELVFCSEQHTYSHL